LPSLDSLEIERADVTVLFRPPTRPNTFLQTRIAKLGRNDDPENAVRFLLPFLTDSKKMKVQLFTRTREQASILCELTKYCRLL
jgi:hypothetical protein